MSDVRPAHSKLLPACKQRWVTSAVCVQQMLVCGDRAGSIHVYDLTAQVESSRQYR